jgi:hypothetical protein
LREIAVVRRDEENASPLHDTSHEKRPELVADYPCTARHEDNDWAFVCGLSFLPHGLLAGEVDVELMAYRGAVRDVLEDPF